MARRDENARDRREPKKRSVLLDSGADLLIYGMGESAVREIAAALRKKRPVGEITEVRGTAYLTKTPPEGLSLPSFEQVRPFTSAG